MNRSQFSPTRLLVVCKVRGDFRIFIYLFPSVIAMTRAMTIKICPVVVIVSDPQVEARGCCSNAPRSLCQDHIAEWCRWSAYIIYCLIMLNAWETALSLLYIITDTYVLNDSIKSKQQIAKNIFNINIWEISKSCTNTLHA